MCSPISKIGQKSSTGKLVGGGGGAKIQMVKLLWNTFHSQQVLKIQKMCSLTYLRGFDLYIVTAKNMCCFHGIIERHINGYHGNDTSDMVYTILFLKHYDKANNLRSFSMKLEHFTLLTCRDQNLTFDLLGCNSKTVSCSSSNYTFFWILDTVIYIIERLNNIYILPP